MKQEDWQEYLPDEYRNQVAMPLRYERHEEPAVEARRTIGFDAFGRRCYLSYRFQLSAELFDAEEFPIEVATYRERVVAWRLADGRWLKLKSFADRLDSCHPRSTRLPLELTDEAGALR